MSASVGHAENSADGEHAHPPVIANGHANGYQNGVVANGHVGVDKDDDTRSTCSEQAPGAQWAPVTGAWRALRRQLLASRAPPAVPELFRTPAGVPALHGVAHQISEEQMERIKLTEGGGGNKDMGASTLPSSLCPTPSPTVSDRPIMLAQVHHPASIRLQAVFFSSVAWLTGCL